MALLAGFVKLLAIDDLLQGEDLAKILALARKPLATLFRSARQTTESKSCVQTYSQKVR